MSMKNNALFEVHSKGSNSDLSRTVAECISLQRKIVNFFKEAMHTVQSICACVLENLCGQNYNNKGMNAKSGLEIVVCIPEKTSHNCYNQQHHYYSCSQTQNI